MDSDGSSPPRGSKKWWDNRYVSKVTPWDEDGADPFLVECLSGDLFERGRALDLGCGTGSNTCYIVKKGFDTTGVDISSVAIESAIDRLTSMREKTPSEKLSGRFRCMNVINDDFEPGEMFDFVFDRGCFHIFGGNERDLLVQKVHKVLNPGGIWCSIVRSADGPERPDGSGPPRHTATKLVTAWEPFFEILSLKRGCEDAKTSWFVILRRREKIT